MMQAFFSNFPLILIILVIVTGVIWVYDRRVLAKRRKEAVDRALAEFDARAKSLQERGIAVPELDREKLVREGMKRPRWVEWTGAFFPVIAAVFFVRSFLWEPFRIPSGSMIPTLAVGDMILVSKYSYGLRFPVGNAKMIETGTPKRGEVVVFKYPKNRSIDYIKRIVAVGGDRIDYVGKRLYVNGEPAVYESKGDFLDREVYTYAARYDEKLPGVKGHRHDILVNPKAPAYVPHPDHFKFREMCTYHATGFSCIVPKGHYFAMGDNRDNSLDSRFWGFVSDDDIVGEAFFVWLNLGDMTRIGGIE